MNWFGKHWVTLYCKQKESSLKVSWMVVTCRYKGKQTFFLLTVNTKRIIDLLKIQENSNFRFIWYSLSIWNFFLTDTKCIIWNRNQKQEIWYAWTFSDIKKVTSKTFKVIRKVSLCHLILSRLSVRNYTAKDKECVSNWNMS